MLNDCVCCLVNTDPVVENGVCYVLHVCVLSRYLSPSSREWYLLYVKCFVCVVSLSHPSSGEWYLLYVKCLCLLSRYLSPIVENGICYMLNVCVCCLVISAQ